MSQFEFIQITYAIILGFGIAQLLRNLGDQIRHRAEDKPYALQVCASLLVLLAILSWLWGSWNLKDVQWNFLGYIAFASIACALALAAYVMQIDRGGDAQDKEAQYFSNVRVAYPLLALTPFAAIANSMIVGVEPLVLPRLLFAGLILSLVFIRKPTYHWIVLGVVFVAAMTMVSLNQFGLG